jgi:hypothetical protein
MTDAGAIEIAAIQGIYKLLEELEPHISGQDGSGRALLYRVKERVRMLIIGLDRHKPE